MLPAPTDVIQRWNDARKEIHAECAGNEKRLVLAELVGLRELALQVSAAKLKLALQVSHRRKSFVR